MWDPWGEYLYIPAPEKKASRYDWSISTGTNSKDSSILSLHRMQPQIDEYLLFSASRNWPSMVVLVAVWSSRGPRIPNIKILKLYAMDINSTVRRYN